MGSLVSWHCSASENSNTGLIADAGKERQSKFSGYHDGARTSILKSEAGYKAMLCVTKVNTCKVWLLLLHHHKARPLQAGESSVCVDVERLCSRSNPNEIVAFLSYARVEFFLPLSFTGALSGVNRHLLMSPGKLTTQQWHGGRNMMFGVSNQEAEGRQEIESY